MTVQIMLAPNPSRPGGIDRVVVLGRSEDQQRLIVLNVNAIHNNPALLQPYNPGYRWATSFWSGVSVVIFLAGVALSFYWHWWAFIPGIILGSLVAKATRQSSAEFAIEAISQNKDALRRFAELGLVWEAEPKAVVPGI